VCLNLFRSKKLVVRNVSILHFRQDTRSENVELESNDKSLRTEKFREKQNVIIINIGVNDVLQKLDFFL